MCARRFLILIFVVILIFVGGAFAIYQWGSEVLVRSATPRGHFQTPPRGSRPDYSKDASWLAKPDLPDAPAAWIPDGVVMTRVAQPAATFFIHPTTYLERDRWNAPLDPGGDTAVRTSRFVQSQASAFNAVSDIWAPKYRQAAFGAFLLTSDDATRALDLAYGDVRSAFDAFLAAQPGDRPVILAAHSQGSMHLLRLLADRKDAIGNRLVAVYVVGWPVGITADLPATRIGPCLAPDQPACLLSWQSFKDPANPRLVTEAWVGTPGLTGKERRREDMLCTNPLTGTPNGEAGPAVNPGTLVPNGDFVEAKLESGRVGARCEDGFLIIDGDLPNLGPYVLPGNNYHVYDYALFWGAIRADAGRRLAAWRAR